MGTPVFAPDGHASEGMHGCMDCPLGGSRAVLPIYVGDPQKAKLLVIGEGSGETEVQQGEPFVGDSGKVLRNALALAGCYDYALTNAVLHHPPKNRTPKVQEWKACSDWLYGTVAQVRPEVVLCVGKTAQAAWEYIRGDFPKVYTVFTHHPAYTLRRPSMLPEFQKDVAWAVNRVDELYGVRAPTLELPPPTHLAVDTEYTMTKPHRRLAWTVSDGVGKWYEGGPLITYPTFIFHHAKVDMPLLGYSMGDVSTWEDTMLMAYCLREPEVGLKPLARKLLGLHMTEYSQMLKECTTTVETTLKNGKVKVKTVPAGDFREALVNNPERAKAYAMEDAYATALLYPILSKKLAQYPTQERYYREIEKPTSAILAGMEQRGIRLDQNVIRAASDYTLAQEQIALAELPEWLENPYSNAQVSQALQEMGAVLTARTESGTAFQVDEDVLLQITGYHTFEDLLARVDEGVGPKQKLLNHFCASLLTARKAKKFKSTYCDAYMGKDRIYTDFNQTQADTNRLSSSDPNLQNVPKGGWHGKIRNAFLPESGHVWLRVDCEQMELRILAGYTKDPSMLRAFPLDGSKSLVDVHQATADALGIKRDVAKNAVYAKAYGSGVPTFAKTAGISEVDAAVVYQKMGREMPGLAQWAVDSTKLFEAQGYLESLLGWRMVYPHYWSPVQKQKSDARLSLINGRIQATGAGLFKVFMIRAQPILSKYGAVFLLQVHDEAGISCQQEEQEPLVRELGTIMFDLGMEYLGLPLVLSAEYGPSWGQAKVEVGHG